MLLYLFFWSFFARGKLSSIVSKTVLSPLAWLLVSCILIFSFLVASWFWLHKSKRVLLDKISRFGVPIGLTHHPLSLTSIWLKSRARKNSMRAFTAAEPKQKMASGWWMASYDIFTQMHTNKESSRQDTPNSVGGWEDNVW